MTFHSEGQAKDPTRQRRPAIIHETFADRRTPAQTSQRVN